MGVRLRAKAQVNLGVRVRVWVTVWGKAHRVLGGRGVGLLALHVVEDAEVVTLRPLLRPPALGLGLGLGIGLGIGIGVGVGLGLG